MFSITPSTQILRSHGMCDDALNVIYKAVVTGRSQGSSCNPSLVEIYCCIRQAKIWCISRHGVRLKFYSHDDITVAYHTNLVDEIDETLFTAVLWHNYDHVLRYILLDRRNSSYCLRPQLHELMLAIRRDSRNKTCINHVYLFTCFIAFMCTFL